MRSRYKTYTQISSYFIVIDKNIKVNISAVVIYTYIQFQKESTIKISKGIAKNYLIFDQRVYTCFLKYSKQTICQLFIPSILWSIFFKLKEYVRHTSLEFILALSDALPRDSSGVCLLYHLYDYSYQSNNVPTP